MLTLAEAKTYLRLSAPGIDLVEDDEVQALLLAAVGMFKVESKRRWPVTGEPALVEVTDPTTVPPTTKFLGYVDPAVLSEDEQQVAGQWLRFTLGHLYENRQTVAVGLNVTEVPATAKALMNMVREPTI